MQPIYFEAMEFYGKGDPYFGGSADDRPLGRNGQFLRIANRDDIAHFDSESAATDAAAAATHRPGGKVGIIPVWR
jgi:hypothetical protein